MGVSFEGVRISLSRQRVRHITQRVLRGERVANALVSVTFVNRRGIRALNARHLKRKSDTDVIAFGYRQPGRAATLVGDIYIAADVARQSAHDNGVSVREELTRLVVHGTLHVAGHDHPEVGRTRSPMWRRQERLVRLLAQ
ncbi:MAG: rRNA maturation RNase YbeY [Gemmatimonadota bacterium]